MYLDRISSTDFETPLITRDASAAEQWEAVLAERDAVPDRRAWPSYPFTSWSGWLSARFEDLQVPTGEAGFPERNGSGRLLLSPGQTERLWRRVIEGSKAGPSLIGSAGVARWAGAARRSLFEHGIVPGEQGGGLWRDDAAVFLEWNRDFEAELDRNGWADPGSLLYRLNRSGIERVAGDLILLDPPRLTPEAKRLVARLRAAGRRVESIVPDQHEARVSAVIGADPAAEIRLAADWARHRLAREPAVRLAVVVPDLESRRDEVEAVFADRLARTRVAGLGDRPIGDIAILGAAVTALRLLAGGGFETLSRWLRSPFFSSRDELRERQAATLELLLRGDPRAQCGFTEAWRRHGLDRLVARYLPAVAEQLDRALERLPARATPTGWTAAWQSCLQALGWHGIERGLPARLQGAWDNAWSRFSALTAITDRIDQAAALEMLNEIVATESTHDPIALEGVTILSRPDRVGPGFSGVWLTGFTDQAQSGDEGSNPLLPWAVQAELDLPGAKPETALAAAIEDLDRLRRRVPEAHFSCPARVGDEPRLPNPLIAGWRRADSGDGRRRGGTDGQSRAGGADGQSRAGSADGQGRAGSADGQGRAIGYAAGRIGARAWLEDADPAPPFAGAAIPGGARTLDLQSACPVKAFCVARLKARPVEPPARGVDPRLRGLLLHRVLELVLDPAGAGPAPARIADAVEQAVTGLARRGSATWQAQLRAERDRLGRIVRRLLEIDAARAPFTTIAVEHRTRIRVGEHGVNCRIDRIDRVAANEELLIDYKTGRSPASRWFDARLGDCQLPLYALGSTPCAIAAIRLDDDRIDYRWAGRMPLSLPGSGREFDADGWRAQIEGWGEQIGALVAEFVAGDTRLPLDATEHVADDGTNRAGGAFAPLTRAGDPR